MKILKSITYLKNAVYIQKNNAVKFRKITMIIVTMNNLNNNFYHQRTNHKIIL